MDSSSNQQNVLLGVRPHSLIEEAMDQLADEFSQAYMQGITSPHQLSEHLQSQWNMVLDGVASELASLSATVSRTQVAEEKIGAELENFFSELQPPLRMRFMKILDSFSILFVVLFIFGSALISPKYLQRDALGWLTEPWWHGAVVSVASIVLILGVYLSVRRRRMRSEAKYIAERQSAISIQRLKLEDEYGLDTVRAELTGARERARLAIIEKLKFEGRAFHEDKSEASYSIVLPQLVRSYAVASY